MAPDGALDPALTPFFRRWQFMQRLLRNGIWDMAAFSYVYVSAVMLRVLALLVVPRQSCGAAGSVANWHVDPVARPLS